MVDMRKLSTSLLLFALGCAPKGGVDSAPQVESEARGETSTPVTETAPVTPPTYTVRVTLDGAPVAGARISQGGHAARWLTDADGLAQVTPSLEIDGDQVLMASHPEARITGIFLPDLDDSAPTELLIELERYSTRDNIEYAFQDPGEPTRNDTTAQCAHCHVTLNTSWFASPHRGSAKNPAVLDLYAGLASAKADAAACAQAGGEWRPARSPGGEGLSADACHLGAGVLPDLNPECEDDGVCDPTQTGLCADCHAPGIDGRLGGRDLLDAKGYAYDYGVHCDVCHKVESVDLTNPAPGVAGALKILRPAEAMDGPTGPWEPLTFGPYDDVINPRMGSVARDHLHDGQLCGGCHELNQAVLVPGEAIDLGRWPEGRLPIHTTYSEWAASPFAPEVSCVACHMPALSEVGNSADLVNLFDIPPGVAGGWVRPPGSVRDHAWVGPRQPESGMLQLAGSLSVSTSVSDEGLDVSVTVTNSGPAHALPTGEPMRAVLLRVEASCDGEPLAPIGGDVVPDWGGAVTIRAAGEDWTRFTEAQVGDVLRVIARDGGFVDYLGWGPFGDGTFSAEEKGWPAERLVGERVVLAVGADGALTLDAPLPAGDAVALIRPSDPAQHALAPGWAFARVLVDAEGAPFAPHHAAVDVRADNRLVAGTSATTSHRFAGGCEAPLVRAWLIHRPFPYALSAERGWAQGDQTMTETWR